MPTPSSARAGRRDPRPALALHRTRPERGPSCRDHHRSAVLIGAQDPGDLEGAISAASLAELHFGTLVAGDPDERARRAQRLGVIEATFDPLPISAPVAREWARLAAAVADRGGRPRRRAIDLAIAATANVHAVPLLTADTADLAIIADLVEVRAL